MSERHAARESLRRPIRRWALVWAAVALCGMASPNAEAKSEAKPRPSESTAKVKSAGPQMSAKAEQGYKSGLKAFRAGDLKGAETQFKAALKVDKNAYLVHYAQAVVQERLGNVGGAAKSYRSAIDVAPAHQSSIVGYCLVVARQGKHDDAVDFVQKKMGELGPSAALVSAKAEVRSMQGRSGEAQELAQQALKIDPNYKPAMVTLARDHYRARRIDLALYALTGILDGYGDDNPPRDKDNAEARMLRGLIYAERDLKGPAMEEMERALKSRPDLIEAHLVLANYMMDAGNAKDARPHLEAAVRFDSKNLGAHLQLGDAYRLLGRPNEARKELEWVLKAQPNQAAAHYNLGLVFLLGGSLKGITEAQAVDSAIEHLDAYKARAVRGGPDDVDELLTRAKTRQAMLKSQQQPAAQ
jgi:Tfp pilus assembly protein PilF